MGGVIAFIFGNLIIPPLLNIYRKYYGGKMALFTTYLRTGGPKMMRDMRN